jgi:hypothetical protein
MRVIRHGVSTAAALSRWSEHITYIYIRQRSFGIDGLHLFATVFERFRLKDRPVLTITDYLNYLHASTSFVEWPPDVFAVAMSLLQKSGAYTHAISDWPPTDAMSTVPKEEQVRSWADRMKTIGEAWRVGVLRKPPSVPSEVRNWWQVVLQTGRLEVASIRDDDNLCSALLQLCAVADEASVGVGLSPTRDEYDTAGWLELDNAGTLCRNVDPTIVRVLPKCHTPKLGMTVRSLSHHLSLVAAGDVLPQWYVVESRRKDPAVKLKRNLNLLLIPLPRLVLPDDFREADGPIQNMDAGQFGFFTYDAQSVASAHVIGLFERASAMLSPIDGVILPELSLSEEEYIKLKTAIVDERKAFLIAGVGGAAIAKSFGTNYVRFDTPVDIPLTDEEDRASVDPQHKHHRWLLDGPQINQYGLSRSLKTDRKWWECIDISRRRLAFVSMEPWLTLSVLICEDLARQDPVADLIRSVGPNLVVALLADGPQLAARWSARYATVLADDPGSSVLTLTNVGMVDLCRGPRRMLEARPVALWKDALSGGPYELNLPADADALLLCLGAEYREEWTADGRSDKSPDGGTTSYLTMQCVHPIPAS